MRASRNKNTLLCNNIYNIDKDIPGGMSPNVNFMFIYIFSLMIIFNIYNV